MKINIPSIEMVRIVPSFYPNEADKIKEVYDFEWTSD